jgi:hypothetical protein
MILLFRWNYKANLMILNGFSWMFMGLVRLKAKGISCHG